MDYSTGTCEGCLELDQPPNMILTIPPPPMPTFFASSFFAVDGNRSITPCPLLCDWTTGLSIEFDDELHHTGNTHYQSWFLLTISSFSIILILAMLTTVLLLKCRQNYKINSYLQKSSFNDRRPTYESILYPSMNQNQVLWATLNRNGKPQTIAVTSATPPVSPRSTYISSLKNTVLTDVDYFSGTAGHCGRPKISSPRCIESPNMPPLNFYPSLKRQHFSPLL